MPYSKDLLDFKRNILKAAAEAADTSQNSYFDQDRLILDVRKAIESHVPYSGLGARSPNDYFPSIKIIGARLQTAESNELHKDYEDNTNIDTNLIIGQRYSSNSILTNAPFFVSGMSYGSLKLPAKIALHLALNRLAKDGIKIMMNTGEGGALPWELYGSNETRSYVSKKRQDSILNYAERLLREHNLDSIDRDHLFCRFYPLITQYASGRFWRDPSYLLNADAIEIKIGQGAKIGHGGLLPGPKVTELVAENRGIPSFKVAHSPSRHLDILGPEDLVAKILELREITDWKIPIIVKVGSSRVYDDIEIILKSYADAASLDGLVGGTGAAPWELRDMIGINTVPSLKPAKEAIYDYYPNHQDDKFQLLVHGSVWDAERIAKCIALGANGVGIGTGFLISMGCTLVQDCYTNMCPAGLTGSYEKLDIEKSIDSIVNYVKGTLYELKNIARSLGRKSIHDIRKKDLVATDQLSSIASDLPLEDGQTYKDIIKKRIATFLREKNLTDIEKPTIHTPF
ncbi:MAG TPA: FMN-binding glutamate synthase family protein [Nitrososphaeraceae archaeon]|nr:FMN-binding glutamate synthase family protein [Nitrososphaeraceae archaeon]